MSLAESKAAPVRLIMQGAPDALLRRMSHALAAASSDPTMAAIGALVEAEIADRLLRDSVLAPLVPAADATLPPPRSPLLSPKDYALVWRRLGAAAPEALAAVREAFEAGGDDASPHALDALCTAGLSGLATGTPEEQRAATLIALTPALRKIAPTIAARLRNLNADAAAVLRLAYKDAAEIAPDAGALFVQVLFAHLDEPWRILGVVSAIADRPSDRYVASSELGATGAALLDDAEARLAALRAFSPERGAAGGAQAAASVSALIATLAAFETWLTLRRDGPWGARVAVIKRELSITAEARLRETEPAVAQALPTQPVRSAGGRVVRPGPKLGHDLDHDAVIRAEAHLAFLHETSICAPEGGFGALRSATAEAIAKRLETYADDMVGALHEMEDDVQRERLRAHLECAADFTGFVADARVAQTVRRRAAAA